MLIVYYTVGAWGFYRLGLKLKLPEFVAGFLAMFGAASPALAIHATVGHVIFANVLLWPAILSFLLDATSDRWSGLKAGALFALGFNEIPYYVMQYGGLTAGLLWLWQTLRASGPEKKAYFRFASLAIASALPFMTTAIAGIVAIAHDYGRIANTPVSFTAVQLAHWYLLPITELKDAAYVPSLGGSWGTWETACYLGWGGLAFFIYGLFRGPRWFHALAALCFVLSIGNSHDWQPMHWLMSTRAFASLQTFARVRLLTHVFFAIGVAWGVASAWSFSSQKNRKWILVGAAITLIEVSLVSNALVRHAHFDYIPPPVANNQGQAFYQMAERKPLPTFFDGWPADLRFYAAANIGIVRELAAIDSAFRFPSHVRTVRDSDYKGEFSQAGHPILPNSWSPNKIVFNHLKPEVPLTVNLNRGNPWRNFGQPLFLQDRIVELDLPFEVLPNSAGAVELTYVPSYVKMGLWMTVAAWISLLVLWRILR